MVLDKKSGRWPFESLNWLEAAQIDVPIFSSYRNSLCHRGVDVVAISYGSLTWDK